MHRTLSFLLLTCSLTLFAQSPINGPMPGYSECLESAIWLQCHGPCNASIEYWKADRPDSVLRTPAQQGERDRAYAMRFIMDEVVPGTRYGYRVLVDGKAVDVGEPLFFHTQPLWRWRGDPPEFSVATGSCAYINEPVYDRPGKPYGGRHDIFDRMARQQPDLTLWLPRLFGYDLVAAAGHVEEAGPAPETPDLPRPEGPVAAPDRAGSLIEAVCARLGACGAGLSPRV